MIKDALIVSRIQKEVDFYNQPLGSWEQLKKFILLPREFSIDEGELTPKLSMKRKAILAKYSESIEKLYA